MRYKTEKILLSILFIELCLTVFVFLFYNDMYAATINGRSYMNDDSEIYHVHAQSWAYDLRDKVSEFLSDENK